MRGKIYILTNDAMPDYIKIGFTTHEDVLTRLKQLDTTGLPLPFRLHACLELDNAQQLERLAHEVFAGQRARSNREFFLLEPETAVKYLRAISFNDKSARWITADHRMIDESGKAVLDTQVVKPKRPNFTFTEAQIPVGSFVHFVRDPEIAAKVISENEVEFEGAAMKLSPLTKLLFERRGALSESGVYAGPDYFTFEDEILSDRRRRLTAAPAEEQ